MERTTQDVGSSNGQAPMPEFKVMWVTPDLAREWLEHNTHNRPTKWKNVKQYVGAMRRGEWKLNNDAITFDYNGVLTNGQNRLWAVVEFDQAIELLVGFNLEPEAQDTMDMGVRRSLADALVLQGETNTAQLASVIRLAYAWERHMASGAPMDPKFEPPTLQQALVFFNSRRSRLVVATSESGKVRNKIRAASHACLAMGWYIFHELDWEDCQDFFYKLGLGASLEEEHPIFVLRRWVFNAATQKNRKVSAVEALAVQIKAWNAYRAGERVKMLGFKMGGAAPERFPVAQ